MPRKLLLSDVDDIALDWIGDFNESIGQDREYIPKAWGYPELGLKYEVVRDFIQTAPVHPHYPEVVHFLNKAREAGWELVMITSHPTNKTLERLENLNRAGLRYDHVVFTQSFDTKGDTVPISKAEYVRRAYSREDEPSIKILFDDRLKSVNEFVTMGLGMGVSVSRAYNDADEAFLRSSPLHKQRIALGVGETRKAQLMDALEQLGDMMDAVDISMAQGRVR